MRRPEQHNIQRVGRPLKLLIRDMILRVKLLILIWQVVELKLLSI